VGKAYPVTRADSWAGDVAAVEAERFGRGAQAPAPAAPFVARPLDSGDNLDILERYLFVDLSGGFGKLAGTEGNL
jgi:hypothetical protein